MSKTYEEWIDHYAAFYKRLNYDLGDVLSEINMVRGTPDMGRDQKDAALCVLDHMEDDLRSAAGEYGEPMRVAGPAALFRDDWNEEDEAVWRDEDRVQDSNRRFQ